MDIDLIFIINESETNLLDRFRVLIKDGRFFNRKAEDKEKFRKSWI